MGDVQKRDAEIPDFTQNIKGNYFLLQKKEKRKERKKLRYFTAETAHGIWVTAASEWPLTHPKGRPPFIFTPEDVNCPERLC